MSRPAEDLSFERVLAGVRRGQVAYLALTQEQNRALRDPDGKIALDVLRHLLGARPMNPERFPLTERAFQAVARKLGYVIGQKRCRHLIRRLRATRVIGAAGRYRQPYRDSAVRSRFCATLYRLGRRLRAPRPRVPRLSSESVLSTAAPPSRRVRAFVGGSIRSLATSWGCRRHTCHAARCGGCTHWTSDSKGHGERCAHSPAWLRERVLGRLGAEWTPGSEG